MNNLTSNETIIKVENASLRRGDDFLLNNFSWELNRGQHCAVLGANGAGKTVLMNLLTGYIWPTEGRISILGETLGRFDLRVLRRRLGWVSPSLEAIIPGDSTVMEVILSGPSASLGLVSNEARPSEEMDKALELSFDFGLGNILNKAFGLLSSGEKQRTLLARAQLAQPDIMFLDEPMSNLDMGGREYFMAHLTMMASRTDGPTIVLATHNTLEIGTFMNHALLMKKGRKIGAGLLDEVLCPHQLMQAFDLPLKVEKTPSGRYLAYL